MELYPFQKKGVAAALSALKRPERSFIYSDEMGLGKTLQALRVAEALDIKKCLIVAPNAAKEEWVRMIKEFTDKSCVVVNSKDGLLGRSFFYVMGYDRLRLMTDDIVRLAPDLLIVDECHMVKQKDALRTQALMSLTPRYKLFLSGTLITKHRDDLWTILNAIDPGNFPTYNDFIKKYCTIKKQRVRYRKYGRWMVRFINKVTGGKNTKELVEKIRPYIIRRTKAQVLPELPPKVYQKLYVDLSREQQKAYNSLSNELRTEIDGQTISARNAMAKFTRLRQICQTTAEVGENDKSSKLDLAVELVQEICDPENNNKALVFTPFVATAKCLCKRLKGFAPAFVVGSISDSDMGREKERFQTDKKCRVYVGTIAKNMQSINLQQATHVIFVGKSLVPAFNVQAEDRAHRIGQKNTVVVIHLLTRDTVEERIEEILQDKIEDFNDLFGEKGETFNEDLKNIRRLL